ncbi:hypothetical protein [Magnetococcus sp. PR-3]|uniref:hypothetical protein n=1 Tax=Magnetococcus sp. PR-3 TaxID=3120355 RepID=UPI002FCE3EF2
MQKAEKPFFLWRFLDELGWPVLIMAAVMLGMAPFPAAPEPHLVEKIKMLMAGTLVKPMDIFDLFLHGTPPLLLVTQVVRYLTGQIQAKEAP